MPTLYREPGATRHRDGLDEAIKWRNPCFTAKQSATRARRVEKAAPRILAGKGLRDR